MRDAMSGRRLAGPLVLFALSGWAHAAEAPLIERWDRVVCLHTEAKKSDGQPVYACAFLIRRADCKYLVTAGHIAQDTHSLTRVLYRAPDGSSRWIHVGALTDRAGDPWCPYENCDVSIMPIAGGEPNAVQIEELAALAIDFDSLLQDAPPRTTDIEIAGFPMSLGTRPMISGLAMKGHLASRELLRDAKWGAEPILFAVPVVGGGCSGGPVFQSLPDSNETKLVGMCVGLRFDATGAKLAEVLPSRVIRAAVCRVAGREPCAEAAKSDEAEREWRSGFKLKSTSPAPFPPAYPCRSSDESLVDDE